jgi:hypothetical protein
MLKRGYIILIVGAILFFSGIIISILWASSFLNAFLGKTVLLADVSIQGSSSINNTLQIDDLKHPLILQLHFENNDNDNNNGNNTAKQIGETVQDPNGKTLSQNNFSKEFSATIKPTIEGKYTLSVHNYGNASASLGGVFGPVQFINQDNQVSFSFFNGVIIGFISIVLGILTIFVGLIVAIMDRRRSP